ncbi:MAG: M20/M25/M40 family metallo-hydrolase [Lachnospiraceae bacterium]|nr:M20/M25/M40 family metallo-hydrolase [Lachnospiraceae bacterium]
MEQNLLEMLLNTDSVSGEEFALQDQLEAHMKPFADSCERDAVGDGIYTVNGKEPDNGRTSDNGKESDNGGRSNNGGSAGNSAGTGGRTILLAAHIDEIGLMVTGATEDGFLRVINAGVIRTRTYPGHGVKIRTENGILYGSVVMNPDAFKNGDMEAKHLLIDIGALSKEEALSNVRPGDTVVFDASIRHLQNGRIRARGLDDKTGVYTIMEALKRVREQGSVNTVMAAATAGEEISKHGARWVAERKRPDEAIIVDVTYTSDYDGMRDAEWGEVSLGKGPALCVNAICDKKMNRKLMKIAEQEGIPYQLEISSGKTCTDADEIHFAADGIPTALVSIPLRYMHTPAETADLQDLENTIRLLTAYLTQGE